MLKLFNASATDFSTNGLGVITPLKLEEHRERGLNEWYVDCYLKPDQDNIAQGNILLVNTKGKGYQAFRISNIKRKTNRIEIKAYHIVYDAQNYLLDDVRPTSLNSSSFLQWINTRTDRTSPYTVSGTITNTLTHYFIRETLLNAFIWAETNFNGIMDIDNYNISLKTSDEIGSNQGYTVSMVKI